MALNLGTLACKETDALQLRHPATDELLFVEVDNADGSVTKLPVEIIISGPASKVYRNAIAAMQNRNLKRGKKVMSAEVLREEGIDLLVACSIKANNLILPNGNSIDTPEAFYALYNDSSLEWVKNQVDAGLGDISNFLGK